MIISILYASKILCEFLVIFKAEVLNYSQNKVETALPSKNQALCEYCTHVS